jgi:hypothetical protein
VFEFLRLSQNPHVTALGGVAISCPANDVMMSTSNPSLLRPSFHTSLGLNYNLYYAGTKVSNLFYAQHIKTLNTTVGLGIQYLNYGSFQLTDNIGNQYGEAKAADYAISLSASKSYLTRWRYGATLKLANSTLIDKKASALLADIGVAYADTINLWYAGAVIKNAGVVIKNYEAGVNQPLPMDLQRCACPPAAQLRLILQLQATGLASRRACRRCPQTAPAPAGHGAACSSLSHSRLLFSAAWPKPSIFFIVYNRHPRLS